MTLTRWMTVTRSCAPSIGLSGNRKADFAPNEKAIKRQAREQAKSLQWWYRDRYRLQPNDPLFLALTEQDLLLEFWTAYYAAQNAKGEAISFEGEDDDYDLNAILQQLDQDADNPDAWEPVFSDTAPGAAP